MNVGSPPDSNLKWLYLDLVEDVLKVAEQISTAQERQEVIALQFANLNTSLKSLQATLEGSQNIEQWADAILFRLECELAAVISEHSVSQTMRATENFNGISRLMEEQLLKIQQMSLDASRGVHWTPAEISQPQSVRTRWSFRVKRYIALHHPYFVLLNTVSTAIIAISLIGRLVYTSFGG